MTKDIDNSLKWLTFTDGACSGNPGPGGWGSIISAPTGKIWEIGGAHPKTTNNQMELLATIEALKEIPKNAPTEVFTDSTYVIKGITQWIWNWIRKDWKTAEGKDVINRELWERLDLEVQRIGKNEIKFNYVRGHAGIPGNERVDKIAVAFSRGDFIDLFRGDARVYDVDLSKVESSEIKSPSPKKSSGPSTYLSLIGSKPERHTTWPDCERRVKGQSGAKFKKVQTPEEERSTLTSWGVDPDYFRRPGQ